MSRELDEQVARALGLEVAGWYNANEDPEIASWWHFSRDGQKQQLAYVENCMCGLYDEEDGWWVDLEPLSCGHLYLCLRAVPFYSSDPATAWELVDTHLPWPQFWMRLTATDTGNWRFDIDTNGGDGPIFSDYAPTREEAICKAFLKWKAAQ